MSTDTNTLQYWLNWRFLLCTIWVVSPIVVAVYIIWKNEGPARQSEDGTAEPGVVYSDESWRPCFKGMHPAWLLIFRVVSFFVLLALLVLNIAVYGSGTLFFYTQWTFLMVTIYFAIGSVLSIHGCRQYFDGYDVERTDRDQGSYASLKGNGGNKINCSRKIAGFWGYLFQIIYQTNAGAVMITDCVFWLVIIPFRAMQDYDLDWLLIGMHSVNAVFLIGDFGLNSLRFPWFRIAYFLLFTGFFVIFQWVLHASFSMWWPYPFLDLSSSLSPLWYLIVASLHLPCYAVFRMLMKSKHSCLSKWFPHSYHLVDKEELLS